MIDDFRPVRPKKPALSEHTQTPPPEPTDSESPELGSTTSSENDARREPAFVPPEEAAAHDESPIKLSMDLPPGAPRKSFRGRLKPHFSWPPSKRDYAIYACAILVLGLGAWGGLTVWHHPAKPAAVVTLKQATKRKVVPTTVPSTLTGLPVDPSVNQRPVTAVMIENSLDARPQSGLGQAGVVFEAVAEGGVTRFMALFQDTAPDNVGPIRSARPYYVQWSMGFDAGYAHVGGSPEGLQDIKNGGVRDLDQFYNSAYYHRISSRAAPHNVYTAIATLNQLEAKKGITGSNFTGFVRKKEAPAAQPNATSIDFSLSGYYYDPHFDYNAASNSYNRSEAGAPHIDANTNTQISPKVVVAMVVPEQQGALDSTGAYYSDYNPIGSGAAYVFQDGTVTLGQWSKSSNSAALTFTDASGNPLALNAGQTWITAVTAASKISYK